MKKSEEKKILAKEKERLEKKIKKQENKEKLKINSIDLLEI